MKEDEVEGRSLEEAILAARQLLRSYMKPFEDSGGAPPPSSYESVSVGDGETVQLLVVEPIESIEEAEDAKEVKGNVPSWVVFILLSVFVLWIFVMSSRTSGGSATSSAVAVDLISNMRTLRAAALMHHAVSGDVRLSENENHVALLASYLGDPRRITQKQQYAFRVTNGVWWVGCDLETPKYRDKYVRERLKSWARERELFGSSAIGVTPVSADEAHRYDTGMNAIWSIAPIPVRQADTRN
jgi:hypothetical protein